MAYSPRWITIFASALSAVLSAFSLYFLLTAFAQYRTEDFLTATSTADFAALGTCVETVTDEQLKVFGYEKNDASCAKSNQISGHDRKEILMRRTLAVSVHGLYHAFYTSGAKDDAMVKTLETVLSATIGNNAPPTVEVMTAYQALSKVNEQTVPTSCDEIYGLTTGDLDADATTYFETLRRGRLDDDDDEYVVWPLTDIPVVCNGDPASGASTVDVSTDLPSSQKHKLYAHCLVQFQFASSGIIIPQGGSFGAPLVGERAGPNPFFYPDAEGFDRQTSSYSVKARMYLGQRFGYCVWAYVPMLLASCYLCADAVVFFIAEATFPITVRHSARYQDGQSDLSRIRTSLIITATYWTARLVRFSIGCAAVFASWFFYGLFVIVPWGLLDTKMGRPICETGAPWGYLGTNGGWKSDWDAGWYELATLITQLVVLVLLPFSTADVFARCNKGRTPENEDETEDETKDETKDLPRMVEVHPRIRYFMRVLLVGLVVGTIVMVSGQAVSGAGFGMAWADGIMEEEQQQQAPVFDAVTLSSQIYDQTIATLMVTVVLGLTLGAAVQRHLLNGVGCASTFLFFGWVLLILVFFLPLLIYASVRSIFNENEANKDCTVFADNSDYDVAEVSCQARFWTFLVGGAFVVLSIAAMTAIGIKELLLNIRPIGRVAVRNSERLGAGMALEKVDARTTEAKPRAAAFHDFDKYALGGFRSADEGFFNYKTGVARSNTESNALLYAPRIAFSLPAAAGYVPVARCSADDAWTQQQQRRR